MLGLLSLLDYPSTRGCAVDQTSWDQWLHANFDCPKASVSHTPLLSSLPQQFMLFPQPVNCLFLHLFVAKEGYHQSAVAELLRTSFVTLPLLHYIFLSSSPEVQLGPVLSAHFSPVPCLPNRGDSTQLWVTERHQHFPVLHIRSAAVEDSDDLMPIFQQCSATDVHQQYGGFHLIKKHFAPVK